MSKFWAKVRFKQEKNAEHLIRAFFQDFNPASSIVVRGKEAKLEIVFRHNPCRKAHPLQNKIKSESSNLNPRRFINHTSFRQVF